MKILTLMLFLISATSFGQYKKLSKSDYDKALSFAEKSMGQYMVENRIKDPVIVDNISDWKGYTLKLYTYKMKGDKLNQKLGKDLIGRVILCNPSAEKLVRWSVSALQKCSISINYFNVLQVLENIKGCSGAQFPVRGIVYEDIAPKDDTNETYAFFDGVTIEGNGIKISTIDEQRVTSKQEEQYLKMTFNEIDKAILYGRISSTLREEYRLVNNKEDTLGKNWVNIVRMEYQKALNSDENNLIYATVKFDLSRPKNILNKKKNKMVKNPEKKFNFIN